MKLNKKGDYSDFIIGSLLVALVTLGLFYWAFGLAQDNGANPAVFNSDKINLTGLASSINESRQNAEAQREAFTSENPLVAFGSIVFSTITGVGKVFMNTVITFYNLVFGGVSNVLGIPPEVTGVLSAILVIVRVLAAWSLYRIGK
jgi:hypothetical protein